MPIDPKMVKWQDAAIDASKVEWDEPSKPKTEPMSKMDKVLMGAKDPISGGAQLLTSILPENVVKAGDSFNNWLADKTGLVAKIPSGGVDALVRRQEAEYQAKRADAGESGFDGYRTIGNVVSPANLAVASKLPAAVGAGKAVIGAAGGAASALLNPVTEGDYWTEKGKQAGVGGAFGAATPMVTGAISRIISPKASTNANLNLLKSEGVKPTIGQTLGGFANRAEEAGMSLPFVGDAISSARNRAKDQFNQAAINRATKPIGEKVQGSGTQAVQEAGDLIGAAYDKAKNSLGGFKIDPQANTELSQLRMLATSGLQGRERSTVSNYFNDYLKRPSLTAESFKELDSKLTSDIAKFGGGDAYQQKVADALKEVQRIVTDNAKRANPKAADALAKADEAWANLVRVEGASIGAKGTEGVFTPGQLLTAVRGADKSVRDRSTARGTALMQDLATAGQSVLGNKLPNSGTADRMIYGGGLLGLGAGGMANLPLTAAGVGAGLTAYTPQMQALLRGLVSSRPQGAKSVADAFEQSAPFLIPGGAQMGLSLLK